MSQLDKLIPQIKLKYNQLKKCQKISAKKQLIGIIKSLILKVKKIVQIQQPANSFSLKRQIEQIEKQMENLQIKIAVQQKQNQKIPKVEIYKFQQKYKDKSKLSKQEMSSYVVRTIVMQEFRSSQLKYTNEELEDVAKKMEKNLDLVKEINQLIEEQGDDLDVIESNISKAYENVVEANKELTEAQEFQKYNRILKIRMGVSAFFGAIGMKIFGLPGLIFGFFTGMGVTH